MTHISTWIDEYHKGSRFGLNGKILIKKPQNIKKLLLLKMNIMAKL